MYRVALVKVCNTGGKHVSLKYWPFTSLDCVIHFLGSTIFLSNLQIEYLQKMKRNEAGR